MLRSRSNFLKNENGDYSIVPHLEIAKFVDQKKKNRRSTALLIARSRQVTKNKNI